MWNPENQSCPNTNRNLVFSNFPSGFPAIQPGIIGHKLVKIFTNSPGYFLLLFLMLVPWFLTAQDAHREIGYPFLTNYSSKTYRAHTQNYTSVQDQRGIVYVGNFAGLLEFDGVNWRLIQTAKQTKVSSLAKTAGGKIYIGARGEIGYLKPDSTGNMRFVDLTHKLSAADNSFFEVNYCYAGLSGIYFITRNAIFFWDEKAFTVWKTNQSILGAFLVDNLLYYQEKGKGIMQLTPSGAEIVKGGEIFTSAMEIKAMLPWSGNKILIATDNQGLFVCDKNGIVKLTTAVDTLLIQSKISCGILLHNNELALGTMRKGIIILSGDGSFIMNIDKSAGLQNEYITSLNTDRDKNLWATLNDGIAHIEYPSPYGRFNETSGIEGGVTGITRHQGKIYAASYQGLFLLNPLTMTFSPVPGIYTACWSVASLGNSLLVASSSGIYEIRNGSTRLLSGGFSLVLFPSKKDPSVIFAGQTDGLLVLKNGNAEKVKGITAEIRVIAEDDQGIVWLADASGNVMRVDYYNTGQTRQYGTEEGLPGEPGNHINPTSYGLLLTSPNGIYTYDKDTKTFKAGGIPTADSNAVSSWIYKIVEDPQANLWTISGDEKNITLFSGNKKSGLKKIITPFLPVADFVAWTIYPEQQGICWFGGPEGILRYDPGVTIDYQRNFAPIIRKVLVNNDSVLFSGACFDKDFALSAVQPDLLKPDLKANENTLRFEFAAPVFDSKGGLVYQYYLEGFDRIWSEWTTASQKEYTNLSRGKYIFHVKAKDIFGRVSPEASFAFRILTPWYLTWFAYACYFLIAAASLVFIVRLRSRQLMKEKKQLENMISERTAEVVQQKEEIEQQSLELSYKNEELERINNVVKSINAQIHFTHLLQSILEKFIVIRGVEKATAIVLDKQSGTYKYKASVGWDFSPFEGSEFRLEDLENKYLRDADELYEDIFRKTNWKESGTETEKNRPEHPASMLIMVIRIEDRVNGFLLLENTVKKDAFDMKDLSFISNLKQHLISAFIKTGLLEDLQKTLDELEDTQDQLVQSEKLASLGQLTAGIAHEIQNPLNFVNNFSALSIDLALELKEFLEKLKDSIDDNTRDDIDETISMIESNLKKINEHGKRAESIVKGMLQHSRGRTGEFELTDINNMVTEYVNLSYHGMRAKDKSFNTAIKTDIDPQVGKINIVPQDLSRVILNIMNNSCYAVDQKAKQKGPEFRPEIAVSTKKAGKNIEIHIRDNGTGIPQSVLDKIFNPFFTTKPTGQGTGLGLSMSYDIINQIHKGKLEVKTEEGEFTEFIISIPENIPR